MTDKQYSASDLERMLLSLQEELLRTEPALHDNLKGCYGVYVYLLRRTEPDTATKYVDWMRSYERNTKRL